MLELKLSWLYSARLTLNNRRGECWAVHLHLNLLSIVELGFSCVTFPVRRLEWRLKGCEEFFLSTSLKVLKANHDLLKVFFGWQKHKQTTKEENNKNYKNNQHFKLLLYFSGTTFLFLSPLKKIIKVMFSCSIAWVQCSFGYLQLIKIPN